MLTIFKPKLHREPLVAENDLGGARKQLATKAANLLGYKTLIASIPGEASLEVMGVFRELGIEPLSTEQVHKYQRWYVRKHSGGFSWEKVTWRAANLSDYEQPIPEFVISRAVELKEKLPNATFAIEFPVKDERPRLDPFLAMWYHGTKYYIDVWDEPVFEGRRTV